MSYLSKVLVVGQEGIGKRTFFASCDDVRIGPESSYNTVGVAINTTQVSVNDGDEIRLIFWNINPRERFHFIFPSLFRGAAGCLLFFDISDHSSFEALSRWLNLIRTYSGNIPIVLIATKSDLSHNVFNEEIDDFIESNELDGYFSTTNKSKIVKNFIFKRLGNKILSFLRTRPSLPAFNYKWLDHLSEEEKKSLQDFVSFFSRCPVCKSENHRNYLERFYLSEDDEKIMLRDKLVELMEYSYYVGSNFTNEIILGIPCCNCFKKYFK